MGTLNPYSPQGLLSRKLMRFHNVDMAALATFTLFQPFNGKRFIVGAVKTVSILIGGTITTQPQFKVTDGTNDIVAAAANCNANQGRAKLATIITDRLVTYAAPLTLTVTTAAAGTAPVFKVDVYIEGWLI